MEQKLVKPKGMCVGQAMGIRCKPSEKGQQDRESDQDGCHGTLYYKGNATRSRRQDTWGTHRSMASPRPASLLHPWLRSLRPTWPANWWRHPSSDIQRSCGMPPRRRKAELATSRWGNWSVASTACYIEELRATMETRQRRGKDLLLPPWALVRFWVQVPERPHSY